MITIQAAIERLVQKYDLTAEEMQTIMWAILSESVTPAQLGGFLVAMRMKGETVEELVAAVQVLKQVVLPVPIDNDGIVDIVGTGGDQTHTFNISTCSAFVVAAAGGKVAKHGNRSVSSRSGGADVLEAAGIVLTLTPQQIVECIEKIGVGFMYAPQHHTAWRHAASPRKELGIRTFFNLIGPLVNPAAVKRQLIGVFDHNWVLALAEILKQLGSQHALVVHGEDGLDEISINAPTQIAELKNNQVLTYQITPEQFGLTRAPLDSLVVENAQESLILINQVLHNKAGPARDIVALNAGAAIYVAGLAENLESGIQKAFAVLADGSAYQKFNAFKEFSLKVSDFTD
jgi:anthranilate phosphoribosyltransferase